MQGLPQKVLDDEILDLELLKQAIDILLEKICCRLHWAVLVLLQACLDLGFNICVSKAQ